MIVYSLAIPAKFNIGVFSDEVVAAGLRVAGTPGDPWMSDATHVSVGVIDGKTQAQVQAVLTAHDGLTATGRLIAALGAADTNWAALTAVQKDTVLRQLAKIVVALLRGGA
jgi:hypothetical protein